MKRLIKKNKAKKAFFTVISTLSLSTICGLIPATIINNSNSISLTDKTTHALNDSGNGNTNAGTFDVSSDQQPLNKTADQVNADDIQDVLTSSTGSSFSVIILPISEKNIATGSVDFLIVENVKSNSTYTANFADASKSTNNKSDTSKQSDNASDYSDIFKNYSIDGKTPEAKNVFATNKFDKLKPKTKDGEENTSWITPKGYEITWKSDEEIKEFIMSKTDASLTAQEVYDYVLNSDFLPSLNANGVGNNVSSTKIDVSSITESKDFGNFGNVGLFKIVVTLTDMSSSSNRTTKTETKYLGGFLVDGVRHTIDLNLVESVSGFTTATSGVFNINGQSSALANIKLNEITPSEFASPNGGQSKLISILTNNGKESNNTELIKSDSNRKILSLKFGTNQEIGLNDAASDTNGTGNDSILNPNNNNNSNNQTTAKQEVTNVDYYPNDKDGSLELVVTYKGFDVFSGKVKEQIANVDFPANTFKINPNALQNATVNWKTDSELPMQYSYEIMNAVWKNKDNKEFLKEFSNQFISASSEVQNLDRTVKFTYGPKDNLNEQKEVFGGGSEDSQKAFYQDATSRKEISVQITFNNWRYGNTSQSTYTMTKTFSNLLGYKYTGSDELNFYWRSSQDLMNNNQTYANETPSTLAYELTAGAGTDSASKDAIISKFVLGSIKSETETWFLVPNDANGTITVYLKKKAQTSDTNEQSNNSLTHHLYTQTFVGFKKTGNLNDVWSFAYLSQNEIDPRLLSIPIYDVTVNDVIELYLNNLDLFKSKTLTEEDVVITPDVSNEQEGTATLKVEVTIPFENSTITDSNVKTAVAHIKGFSFGSGKNETEFNPPKDLTAIIAVSSSLVVSVSLGIVLISLLIRRARVRTFKENSLILSKDKDNKKEKNKKSNLKNSNFKVNLKK